MTRTTRILLALLAVLAVAAPAAQAQPRKAKANLTVMTRNIYLGGNIFHPIGEQDPAAFRRKVGELWREIQSTDFAGTRARLLAREVKRTRPDVIGLQEVATYRRGPDGVTDGAETPSTKVVFNFLRAYRRALRRLGLRYRVAVVQREADMEAPTDEGYDIRLQMHDVILVRARRDLRITRRSKDNYDEDVEVPVPSGTLVSTRGWTAVDGRFRGKRFRFVNTHLESFVAATRNEQARELRAPGGPLRRLRGKPVIVVGDFNSDPTGNESDPDAVNILKKFGLRDMWANAGRGPGFSCCLNRSDARDTSPAGFDHRIDLIFAKPRLRVSGAKVVGKRLKDRAANGLWPSDHAGVVMTLRLR